MQTLPTLYKCTHVKRKKMVARTFLTLPRTIPLCNFGIAFSHAICVIVKYFGKLLLKTTSIWQPKSSPIFYYPGENRNLKPPNVVSLRCSEIKIKPLPFPYQIIFNVRLYPRAKFSVMKAQCIGIIFPRTIDWNDLQPNVLQKQLFQMTINLCNSVIVYWYVFSRLMPSRNCPQYDIAFF